MEQKIKVIFGNDNESACEILNKLNAEQKILELFETKEVEEIKVTYKKRKPACTADYETKLN